MEASATPDKVICGPCQAEFATEDEYLAHVCPTSNTTPADPAYLGEAFPLISEKALERGAARAAAEQAQAASEEAPVQ